MKARNRTLLVVGAAAAAAAALVVQQKTRRAERENPPAGRFINVEGVRLHYVERGEGPPVVLLHGSGMMIQDFELSGMLELTAARYRVIAFDRPGYGHSTRPPGRIWGPSAQASVLRAAFKRLGIERPIVVAHSWGTLVALALGLQYPADVRSLVLLSGYYFPTVRLDVPLLSPPALPVVGSLLRYTVSPLLGLMMWPALVRRMFGPMPVPLRFWRFPRWMALRPSQLRASAAEAALMVPAAARFSRRYGELAVPTVIVAGADDRFVDTDGQSVRLHKTVRSSELRLLPEQGHMVHHLAPRKVLAAIDTAAKFA
jgi:pimeloyl-ACP methyl ester carboxylesterase